MNEFMKNVHVYLAKDLWNTRKSYQVASGEIHYSLDKNLKKGDWYAVSTDCVLYRESFWSKKQWSVFYKDFKKGIRT